MWDSQRLDAVCYRGTTRIKQAKVRSGLRKLNAGEDMRAKLSSLKQNQAGLVQKTIKLFEGNPQAPLSMSCGTWMQRMLKCTRRYAMPSSVRLLVGSLQPDRMMDVVTQHRNQAAGRHPASAHNDPLTAELEIMKQMASAISSGWINRRSWVWGMMFC
jgi:hypothetical protein